MRAPRSKRRNTVTSWEMGEITHQGPAAALANDPRVVATYLGGSA